MDKSCLLSLCLFLWEKTLLCSWTFLCLSFIGYSCSNTFFFHLQDTPFSFSMTFNLLTGLQGKGWQNFCSRVNAGRVLFLKYTVSRRDFLLNESHLFPRFYCVTSSTSTDFSKHHCAVSFQKFLHIISRNAFRKRWHRRWRSQEEGQEGHKWSLCCEYSSMFVTSTTASDFQIQLHSWGSSHDKRMSLEINFYCRFQELCCSYFTFDDREKGWDQARERERVRVRNGCFLS